MDKMETVITAILVGFIGILLLTYLMPVMTEAITNNITGEAENYKPLFKLIPLAMIIAVVMGIFKFFSGGSR